MCIERNKNLHSAKKKKNDEFYTTYDTISKELVNYSTDYFKGKIVYCPCDIADDSCSIMSQFVKYFKDNKKRLGYKRLIATCYTENISVVIRGNRYEFSDEVENYSWCECDDIYLSGDFRSDECRQIMSECDIVVTNPPFSLFKEFFSQILEYKKDYIILGSINSLNFDIVFNEFKYNRCTFGYTIRNGHTKFLVPSTYKSEFERSKFDVNGNKYVEVGVRWFSNVCNLVRPVLTLNEVPIDSFECYNNSDIIHIEKTSQIPKGHNGLMGVPITFLDKWNTSQFELLGIIFPSRYFGNISCYSCIGDKKYYARLLIKAV